MAKLAIFKLTELRKKGSEVKDLFKFISGRYLQWGIKFFFIINYHFDRRKSTN